MSSNFPLDKMCVPGSNIYIIGYKATQVSLYAQQVRALDLVYELAKASNDSDEPLSNKRIAVIGAGAAGLTAAAAAGLLGAQVILLEEQAEFMHLQRGCYTRYLHPQIYDWPENTAFAPSSSLPILAWSTGTADAVAEQIVDQFYAINRRLEQKQRPIQCKFGVRNIKINDRTVSWSPSPQKEEKLKEEKNLDAIILALGFGIEKTVEQLPRRSYWRLDSLDQSHLDSTDIPYKVLVAGTGDGGIIDVLRAALIGFDHGPFLDRCLLIMRDEDFLKEVKKLEKDIQSEYEKSIDEAAKTENATKDTKIIEEKAERAASKKLNDGYKEIGQNEKFKKIFKELDELLKQSLRPQSKIVWVGRLAFPPHSTKSMPFNRMLVWRLLEMDNSPIKICARISRTSEVIRTGTNIWVSLRSQYLVVRGHCSQRAMSSGNCTNWQQICP